MYIKRYSKDLFINIQYQTDKTNMGYAWSPMALNGLQMPFMASVWSHDPLASDGAIGGGLSGAIWDQVRLICLVLYGIVYTSLFDNYLASLL